MKWSDRSATKTLSTCIHKYGNVLNFGFRFQVSGMGIALAET